MRSVVVLRFFFFFEELDLDELYLFIFMSLRSQEYKRLNAVFYTKRLNNNIYLFFFFFFFLGGGVIN